MNLDPLEQYKHVERLALGKDSPAPKFVKVTCPSCNSEVPASDINIHDKIGKCTSCNAIFPIQSEVTALNTIKIAKEPVNRPEGIEVFPYQGNLEIIIDPPMHPLEVIIPIFLFLFTFMFTAIFFTKGFPRGVLGLFWVLSSFSVANLINRKKHKAYVSIDEEYLGIYWKPRKFYKNQKFAVSDIDQLYTKFYGGRSSVYLIVNGLDGEKHIKLIEGLESKSKARFLEQEIERHLGITDRSIPEEMN